MFRTYPSSFPFSSDDTLSFWLFSLDWHPMARYWATSGWTRLSICVLLAGSISSLCSAQCASAVSAALCWLVNEHYTIKIHPVRAWVGGSAVVGACHSNTHIYRVGSALVVTTCKVVILHLLFLIVNSFNQRKISEHSKKIRSSEQAYTYSTITIIWKLFSFQPPHLHPSNLYYIYKNNHYIDSKVR